MSMDRRSFIKTAGAASLAGAVATRTALAEDTLSAEELLAAVTPETWDIETEVLILGTGAAGINAGIAAAQAGAEKS